MRRLVEFLTRNTAPVLVRGMQRGVQEFPMRQLLNARRKAQQQAVVGTTSPASNSAAAGGASGASNGHGRMDVTSPTVDGDSNGAFHKDPSLTTIGIPATPPNCDVIAEWSAQPTQPQALSASLVLCSDGSVVCSPEVAPTDPRCCAICRSGGDDGVEGRLLPVAKVRAAASSDVFP